MAQLAECSSTSQVSTPDCCTLDAASKGDLTNCLLLQLQLQRDGV
jgi:hypothetical protein